MRECGECTVCCTILRVPEIQKREFVKCSFCKTSGCSVYAERPESCSKFKCEWLKGKFPESMRPDKSHLLVEKLIGIPIVLAIADKKQILNLEDFTEIFLEYKRQGIAVVASNGFAILPEGMSAEQVKEHIKKVL